MDMRYNKLVRDRIPDIIERSGKIPITHIVNDEEYWVSLKEKLREEVEEFLESENEEELADILEVIYAICDFKHLDKADLGNLRREKLRKKGGFKNRIILDEVK